MPEPLTNDLSVTVNGSELPADVMALLVLAYVEDSRALPDTFELRFRDADRVAIEKGGFTIGATVKLGVKTAEESSTTWIVQGELTSLEVELDGRGSWTVVRGYDESHRLQRGRVTKAYRDVTASDIVGEIAGRVGLSAGTVDRTPVLKEVVQPNLSDWEFLIGLAGDLGREVSVSEGKLNLTKPATASDGSAVPLTLGETLVRFRAAVTAAEHADEVQVRAWDPSTKAALVGKKPATSTPAARIGTSPGQTTQQFTGTTTLTVTDAPYATDQQQVDALAESLAEQIAGVFTEVEAVVKGDPQLHSGTVVELKNVGAPFEGTYVVTTARHVYDGEEGYQVWLTVSGGQDRTMLGLVRPSGSRRGLVSGLVPAIVTNAKDPDKLGRVKVKLPWLDDTFETTWARTLQLGGRSGGSIVLPEVNDEVLVGFEQGHVERPFVLGGLYNGVDKPVAGDVDDVDGTSGDISRRVIASRSGHRMELFDSSSGAKGMRLRTADDAYEINLDQQGGSIALTSGGTVVVEGQGDITVKAGGKITMEAGSDFSVKAMSVAIEGTSGVEVKGMEVDLKADTSASLEGGIDVAVKGNAKAEIDGGAMTKVSGAMVQIN